MASWFTGWEMLHDSNWEFLLRADRTQHMEYEVCLNVLFNFKEDVSTWRYRSLCCHFIISLLGVEALVITKLNVT